jgi:hypothetical protein
MKIDTIEQYVNWSEEYVRLRREGKEPPEPELTDDMRRLCLAYFDKLKATESERQLDDLNEQRELREILEKRSSSESQIIAGQYGIQDIDLT